MTDNLPSNTSGSLSIRSILSGNGILTSKRPIIFKQKEKQPKIFASILPLKNSSTEKISENKTEKINLNEILRSSSIETHPFFVSGPLYTKTKSLKEDKKNFKIDTKKENIKVWEVLTQSWNRSVFPQINLFGWLDNEKNEKEINEKDMESVNFMLDLGIDEKYIHKLYLKNDNMYFDRNQCFAVIKFMQTETRFIKVIAKYKHRNILINEDFIYVLEAISPEKAIVKSVNQIKDIIKIKIEIDRNNKKFNPVMGIDIKKGEFLITKIYEFYENEKNSYFLRNLLKNIQQYNTDIKIIEY